MTKLRLARSSNDAVLLTDLHALLESAREQTAHAVNSGLVRLHRYIVKRIREELLGDLVDALKIDLIGSIDPHCTATATKRRHTCRRDSI